LVGWFLVAGIAAALPIPFIKEYTKTHENIWLVLSAFSYATLIYAYIHILEDENIAIIYPLLKVFSVLIVVAFGILFFQAQLNTKSYIGILSGMASIYLLSAGLSTNKMKPVSKPVGPL